MHQSIKNKKVIDILERCGENLLQPREVNHWIYFNSSKDREDFILKIKDLGFTIVHKNFDKSPSERPYQLQINRVDKVDQKNVDEYTLKLLQLAQETNGEYDGWETSIEITRKH